MVSGEKNSHIQSAGSVRQKRTRFCLSSNARLFGMDGKSSHLSLYFMVYFESSNFFFYNRWPSQFVLRAELAFIQPK